VQIRIAYYAGPHQNPLIPPPAGSTEAFLEPLGVPTRPVKGYQSLMHDKYVIRDGGSDTASIWTGSTNWTPDAWAREENVIAQIPSRDLASHYTQDFEELWSRGHVENTGEDAGGESLLSLNGHEVPARVWFSPGGGVAMSHDVARAISAARERVVIASPVITDGPILGALADVLRVGQVPIRGVYDQTQMNQALHQWQSSDHGLWKVQAFQYVASTAKLAGKRSTPYAPGSVHDYMHVKIVVSDDTVYLGSYNFSRSGEENAENLLRLQSHDVAELCVAYIDRVTARYAQDGAG
jgi:phosphatidylserine/phosphatidylglycerophosphate/cardiolipin synthase-like enzyme